MYLFFDLILYCFDVYKIIDFIECYGKQIVGIIQILTKIFGKFYRFFIFT
jgi:hypothetical protein